MYLVKEIKLRDFGAWAGANKTLDILISHPKWLEKVEEYLEAWSREKILYETDINDFLWFETDYIINDILELEGGEYEFYETETETETL